MTSTIPHAASGGGVAVVAVVIILLYVVVCVAIARYAARKGQSFVLFLLVGLLISPFVSGIVALFIRPGNG